MEAVNVCWRKVSNDQPVLPQSYHKAEDTPEELDYETIGASIHCIVRAIEILTAWIPKNRRRKAAVSIIFEKIVGYFLT